VRFVKRLVRGTVRLVLRLPRVRGLVESELRQRTHAQGGVRPTPDVGEREFVDRFGGRHGRDPDLRDRLKPNWRSMCDPAAASAVPADEDLRGRARKAKTSVAEARTLVATTAGVQLTGRVLEIGCYDGAVAFELARDPGTTMIASDLARYYITQRPESVAGDLAAEQARLGTIRDGAARVAGVDPASVTFVEDDITASALEPASLDAIVSFEVLEHVAGPAEAFAAMARLLRPGGVMYHDYNPFFSSIGGHSLATLDVPWGHARFDDADVERYLREFRPAEADQALRFYRDNLNRMTLADLRAAVSGAGLELLAVVPWNQRPLLTDASPEVLAEVRRSYPSATIDDLLATFVAVVARRPASA
jgi:SAM-dependent methyltransferase